MQWAENAQQMNPETGEERPEVSNWGWPSAQTWVPQVSRRVLLQTPFGRQELVAGELSVISHEGPIQTDNDHSDIRRDGLVPTQKRCSDEKHNI